MADFGVRIAEALNLPSPESYTSHCFKRTGMQFMADAGFSVEKIKAQSHHSSDNTARESEPLYTSHDEAGHV